MADGGMVTSLKQQAAAALVMVALAIISVLGMVVLEEFRDVVSGMGVGGADTAGTVNATIQLTLTAFVAAFALFGTFATLTALVIVVKGIIMVVKGLQ